MSANTKLGLSAITRMPYGSFDDKVSWQPRYYFYLPSGVTDVYVELPTTTSDYKVKLVVPS